MPKGLFITFEGIDGSGKSTMLKKLAAHIQGLGLDVVCTREPGGSRLGRELRRLLLDSAYGSLDQRTETLFFAADRACHCTETIVPALAAGKIVLSDRYTDSTLAYQGGGRGLDPDLLQQLNAFATNGLQPDLTLLFTVGGETALLRQGRSKDRMEREDTDFFQRVAQAYCQLAAAEPARIRVIDGELSPGRVFSQVLAEVAPFLARVGQP